MIQLCCTSISSLNAKRVRNVPQLGFAGFTSLLIASALIHSRFLRARTFQPLLALRQFAAAEAWRRAHGVDRLYATFDPDEFEYSKRFYPRWTGRRDKVCRSPLARLRWLN